VYICLEGLDLEDLKYVIEDSTLIELLGRENFTNAESAILELVKNSFDASATKLDIVFQEDTIILSDNGIGMDIQDIKVHWMHIGKSNKDYEMIDRENNRRIFAGSKGIGRFALARLGNNVQLYSQKDNAFSNRVLWTTNWNKSNIIEQEKIEQSGTQIYITGLRDKWSKTKIEKITSYLSRTYNDNLMEIRIDYDAKVATDSGKWPKVVERYFENPVIGINCTSRIFFKYYSRKKILKCYIRSDEFRPEASEYCKGIDLKKYLISINCKNELTNDKDIDLDTEELEVVLKELGDFNGEFYFSLKGSSINDAEKFMYKHTILPSKYESGVILYRNSFSISSYDGSKDWIGLGKRSRLSPAAATHPTGTWRVRENQLSGKVEIDKKENKMLSDLSNRQGLDENVYYTIFLKLINIGLSVFERYRQSIIRQIIVENVVIEDKKIVDDVIKNPTNVKKLSTQEMKKFISEIKEYKKENRNF
jgi:hypothetical protein